MADDSVLYDLRDGVAHVTLNRPEASNAFGREMVARITEVLDTAVADGARALLLTGAGPRFCAGGDLAAMAGSDDPPALIHELASVAAAMTTRLSQLPMPTIAAVHGAVAGAGIAVMLSCDVVVAARGTKFVLAFSGVGLTPDSGVSYLLPRAIGLQRALDLAVSGRVLTADEALDWGLVTRVTEAEELGVAAGELAARIVTGPTAALVSARTLIRSSFEGSVADSAKAEVDSITRAIATPEAQRLIAAFLSRA